MISLFAMLGGDEEAQQQQPNDSSSLLAGAHATMRSDAALCRG